MRGKVLKLAVGVLLAGCGMRAADTVDPKALLEEISTTERAATGWRATAVETDELMGEGMNIRSQYRVTALVKDGTHMRWETAGDSQTLTVCDGTEHWSYTQPGLGFHISPAETAPCSSPLPHFDVLEENLTAAVVTGTETAQFEGAAANCTVIRADYRIPAAAHGAPTGAAGAGVTMIRTLYIDVQRKLVLKEKAESWNTGSNARFIRTTTFSEYQRNPEIPAEAFRFEVPTGTYLDPGPAGGSTAPLSDGSHRMGDGVYKPELVKKLEPGTTDEARAAGAGGLVLVSLTVAADGTPKDVAVERRLGYGLDEKAVEAVSQWHFKPGLSFGMPVVVHDLVVAVNFPRP